MFRINDPIHGVIEFPKGGLIHRLIETPEFQRLRRIKQLGTVDYIYPGATHTRFAHSIGVAHLVQKAIDSILDQGRFDELQKEGYFLDYTLDQVKLAVTVAGLLHDIGHPPYGHALDPYFYKKKHEENAKEIIESSTIFKEIEKFTKIKDSQETLFLPDKQTDDDKYKVINDITKLINKERKNNHLAVLIDLISSQLDCDRLDYVQRDNYYCGTPIKIDNDYIIKNMKIGRVPILEDSYKVIFNSRAKNAIEHFLISRWFHYEKIIKHKAVCAIEALLIRITRDMCGLDDGMNEVSILDEEVYNDTYEMKKFLLYDDYSFFNDILRYEKLKGTKPNYASCFIERKLPKIVDGPKTYIDEKVEKEFYQRRDIIKSIESIKFYKYNSEHWGKLKNNLEGEYLCRRDEREQYLSEAFEYIFIEKKDNDNIKIVEMSELLDIILPFEKDNKTILKFEFKGD